MTSTQEEKNADRNARQMPTIYHHTDGINEVIPNIDKEKPISPLKFLGDVMTVTHGSDCLIV